MSALATSPATSTAATALFGLGLYLPADFMRHPARRIAVQILVCLPAATLAIAAMPYDASTLPAPTPAQPSQASRPISKEKLWLMIGAGTTMLVAGTWLQWRMDRAVVRWLRGRKVFGTTITKPNTVWVVAQLVAVLPWFYLDLRQKSKKPNTR